MIGADLDCQVQRLQICIVNDVQRLNHLLMSASKGRHPCMAISSGWFQRNKHLLRVAA